MATQSLLLGPVLDYPLLSLVILPIALIIVRCLYRITPLHPLYRLPTYYLPCLSSLWLTYHAWIGDECTAVHKLHQKYGPVVRTGPNSVDISDGDALHPIYVEKGGFRKADFYANFDIDGHKSIFSETEPATRAPRAKAVAAMFSTANLRQGRQIIYGCVDKWVEKLKSEAKTGEPVNILNLTRGLAVDAVSAYLFGESYGGLEEDSVERKAVKTGVNQREKIHGEMSASGMVNSFVAVGRYWYLPLWAFQWLQWIEDKLWPDWEVHTSMNIVDEYVRNVVADAVTEKSSAVIGASYPRRLLDAGFSKSEARAQCTDLIFAGTDSTGMNLATICYELAKSPARYERLRKELKDANVSDDEIQSLPYLKSVIREGLRISMANPSRLPRTVPDGGWTFKSQHFPAGTVVSCTPYELHLNGEVFEDPLVFKPERWLNPTDEMNRDHIAFGLGTRQCIARNLATMELFCAVHKLVEADALQGATCVQDKIEILEWFNSKVVNEKIELIWK